MIPDYPSNSDSKKKPEDKDIKKLIESEPIKRKKSLRKKFAGTLMSGDPKSAMNSVLFDVLIPTTKSMIAEAGMEGIRRLMFGDSDRRHSIPPTATGRVDYTQRSVSAVGRTMQRTMTRQARSMHNFDEIVLTNRGEAELVIDNLFEVISRYGQASVADLYGMVGIDDTHVDHKWGWVDMREAGVTRVRGGYLLDLPEPEPLR